MRSVYDLRIEVSEYETKLIITTDNDKAEVTIDFSHRITISHPVQEEKEKQDGNN